VVRGVRVGCVVMGERRELGFRVHLKNVVGGRGVGVGEVSTVFC